MIAIDSTIVTSPSWIAGMKPPGLIARNSGSFSTPALRSTGLSRYASPISSSSQTTRNPLPSPKTAIMFAPPFLVTRRAARSSRNVGQPDHVLANPIMGHETERRPGSGKIRLAVTKHDRVQIDAILIDQTKFSEASRQNCAGDFNLPGMPGLQLTDGAREITFNKR